MDAERTRWPHTGAILAGGAGRRMGRPKHDVPLADGRRMIDAVAETLGRVSARLVVVGPPGLLEGVERVEDLRAGLGPLGGVEALLSSGIDTHYLVCGCDQPALTPELLRLLTAGDEPVRALRIEGDDTPQMLPLVVSSSLLSSVTTQLDDGRRALRRWLGRVGVAERRVPRELAAGLANVNTPDDLRRLDPDRGVLE